MTTPSDFAQALLVRLGMPVSANNMQALVAAQAIEGGFMANSARFNPLNTTQSMPGSYVALVTPARIAGYSSWSEGLEATHKTLTNGLYGDILASLRASAPADQTLAQPGWKTWGWSGAIGPAASYQAYANKPFPDGGALLPPVSTLFSPLRLGPITLMAPKPLVLAAGLAILTAAGFALYMLSSTKTAPAPAPAPRPA